MGWIDKVGLQAKLSFQTDKSSFPLISDRPMLSASWVSQQSTTEKQHYCYDALTTNKINKWKTAQVGPNPDH